MDFNQNETYVLLDGFIHVQRYRYLYFVIMFTVFILILCFSSIIIFLIVSQRSLHEPMYIFIAALLLNSVMFSTVVYPKLLIDFLSDKQIISYSACLFQHFMFYTLTASEFLLLTAMSYDRYVSICKPLHYSTIMRKRTVIILWVLTWFLPAVHLGVFTLSFLYLNSQQCSFTLRAIFCKSPLFDPILVNSPAMIIIPAISLINVALLPVLLILFSYTRIIMVSYRSCKEVRRKAAQTCLPHLLVLISFTCFISFDVIIVLQRSDVSKTVTFIMTLQMIIYQPLFNPVIYGLKMKEISKHLRKLLCEIKLK